MSCRRRGGCEMLPRVYQLIPGLAKLPKGYQSIQDSQSYRHTLKKCEFQHNQVGLEFLRAGDTVPSETVPYKPWNETVAYLHSHP
jgi:hypothetical protein